LTELIREVVGRLAPENSAILISLKLQACIEGTWDRIRLDQVITNLISNAIKYGSEKPIAVSASAIDDCALLTVQDKGVGISPEDSIRIFDRFGRAANPSSKRGLGIGLWITKHIVEAHGGTVRVESAPGAGSTFIVRLPIQPDQSTLD
jgi:signal transduction histidine kinase